MNYPGFEADQISLNALKPRDYVNPTPKDRYHLVVVGAGPAGLITSIGAAGLGAKVALIERGRMGGDCLNVGCVPSKALLEYTKSIPDPDFGAAFAHLREVRAGIAPHDSVERYTEQGVDVFLGSGAFNAQGQICVDGTPLDARRVIIATGARAGVPPIPGLRESNPMTNEDVFDLTEKPDSIGILGAGVIGCELATVFARLGVEVHLFEMADRVMPLEHERASATVAASLEALGVNLHLGEAVEEITASGAVRSPSGEWSVSHRLVALGRSPNTEDLNLEAAGIQTERGFIVTDDKLRTANKSVYAAGDCTAKLQFTHHADAQARAVVQNALFAPTAGVGNLVVPRCTYTSPEVASVGMTDEDAANAGVAVDAYEYDLAELDRSRAMIDGSGWVRVLTRKGSDKIVGATIVSKDAGELLAPICVAMSNGLGLSAFGKTLLAYPTRSEYLKRLADAYNRSRVSPLVSRVFSAWLGTFK